MPELQGLSVCDRGSLAALRHIDVYSEVRPLLTEIPIGKQGIGFDRLQLDTWLDGYKSRNGVPG